MACVVHPISRPLYHTLIDRSHYFMVKPLCTADGDILRYGMGKCRHENFDKGPLLPAFGLESDRSIIRYN
jgi:hypothetical protein